ncbi:hypothetical protein KJ785_01635, partial [Patescibacteria group bacterium]|nr:hypothetical protein [Patescibacteria group bacterium]
GLLNQCPIDLASDQNEFSLGVGENSCCYPRTHRIASYPEDGGGLKGEPVCPNTLMEIDFNGEIDKDTLKNNFIIAVGHENVYINHTDFVKYDCTQDDMKDVTAIISPTLPTPSPELGKLDDNQGFFNKIWNFVKRFFVRIFSNDVLASNQSLKDITVWCAGNITAEPKVKPITETITVDGKKVETTVGSTVSFYLNNLLPKDSYIALYLKGGNQGITDVRGVGIKNAPPPANESNQLNDSIIFYTGSEVCKIFQVNVEPASYLFTQPFSTNFFTAFVKTASQQSIVPIEGVYYWDLDWQPQNHPIVDIPVAGYEPDYTSSTPMTIFGAKNLQGSLMAVANAKVTADITEGENHLGKVFTGFTKLEVNFCENPWPAVGDSGVWSPFEDSAYNFSMSYCADAGLSGDKFDDLPFLNYLIDLPIKTIQTQVQQVGYCEMSEVQTGTPGVTNAVPVYYPSVPPQVKKSCLQDSECSKVYNLPFASNHNDEWNEGKCAPDSTTVELMTNNCTLYSFQSGQGYCMGYEGGYPPEYGSYYVACNNNDDCSSDNEFCEKDISDEWIVKNQCLDAGGITTQEILEPVFHLKDEVLIRYILFNPQNDDVIGVQILKNSAKGDEFEAKSIESWYGERFDNLAQMQKIEVAGYEGLTDGRDYYINALNETVNKKIYSNVYLLSINKEAQQDTLQVFEKLLNSLQFNINITDHGRCLAEGVVPDNGLPTENNINSITGFDCVTDFDCRDLFGLAIAGTNGVCSNAKTKLFRDWARLPKIKELQTKMEKMDKPELGSGTYLPGYTASKWPSWLGLFGVDKVDEVNKWVGCGIGNKSIDSQTCWNAVSSTYHCP